MACQECEERRRKIRDAIFKAKVGEAAKHMVLGAAEIVGIKKKDDAEVASAPKRRRVKPD